MRMPLVPTTLTCRATAVAPRALDCHRLLPTLARACHGLLFAVLFAQSHPCIGLDLAHCRRLRGLFVRRIGNQIEARQHAGDVVLQFAPSLSVYRRNALTLEVVL